MVALVILVGNSTRHLPLLVEGGKVSKLRKPGGGGAVESSAELQSGDMLLVRLDPFPSLI